MSAHPMIFGTDGLRDRAGEGLLRPASVGRLACATAAVLRRRASFPGDFAGREGDAILIARDTRESGEELLEAISGEFRRQGFPVADLGILPTAGAAYMASSSPDCCLAVVISASHNPAEYNGIKFLAPSGAKISARFERAVSDAYHQPERSPSLSAASGGSFDLVDKAWEAYTCFLAGSSWRPERLCGKRIVLDTANGAAFRVAPAVFRSLGMEVECIGDSPDGRNINDGCGALHPERLSETVRAEGAALGFCFDGDADRVVAVTGAGNVLDGDYILALAGRGYSRKGRLPGKTVVGTVMSNIGLEQALQAEGLRLERTPVGDRHVYQRLFDEGHPLGGEQSGHIILMDDLPTGDGILAAIRLLDVLDSDSLDLEGESSIMRRCPQVLRNVRVQEKPPLDEIPAVVDVVADVERRLGRDGRVLVRYSGTEPLARVMIEGPDETLIADFCARICWVIEESLAA